MNTLKKFLDRIFIDGLSGMALGLFATLIIGTIIQQIASLLGGSIGNLLFVVGKLAASVTGAGIGCGVAYKLKASPLTLISATTTGMIGAFAGKLLAGSVLVDGVVSYAGPGEPLGAFIAAYIGIEAGNLVAGKTKVDILITPLVSILAGSAAGLWAGPPISSIMNELGTIINWATMQHKFVMGIVVSVLMGMILTLPISSAALGIVLNLSGLAAGAATIGCCANMIGFAVASYRENRFGGLLAQGIGTSMLQVPNIMKKPIIWLPAIIASAILGPISTCVLGMTNNAAGSGMGTSGLVGQIMTYQTMAKTRGQAVTIILILFMHFILPGILAWVSSEFMRKIGWIKNGDMKLEL
ncbi:PTS transporter subunit IIC [Velocimicrobium porci]|uniref:PTS sugar transporter subunit IIC n=1 Tax=Velocimicrobium porci TaxID=2606634 RepID=A0A6L5XZ75_9FIRM|nr:PTS sugar transporter subunit IIC [Velocimicrobium porci]MSS63233.1 PTS sugar transporter subunit IIC [Velocimicrobium porci]